MMGEPAAISFINIRFQTLTPDHPGKAGVSRRLKKPVPAWSLLLALLAAFAGGLYAHYLFGLATTPGQSNAPDFNLGMSPASMMVIQGNLTKFTISLTSLNGFEGSVNLNVSISPNIQNATTALNPESVSLLYGTGSATLTIQIPPTTRTGTYTITIAGTARMITHDVDSFLQVITPPPPDFQMRAGPSALNVTRGSAGTSTVYLTSTGGFSGTIMLSVSISPSNGSSPTIAVSPNKVTLSSGVTASAVLTVTTTGTTSPGSYTITIQGANGISLILPHFCCSYSRGIG